MFPSNHMMLDMTSPRVRAYLLNEVVSFGYKIWRQLLFKLIILPSVTESIFKVLCNLGVLVRYQLNLRKLELIIKIVVPLLHIVIRHN